MTTKPLDLEMNIVKVTLADESQRSFRVNELSKKNVGDLLRELRAHDKFPYTSEDDAVLFEYMPPNKKLKREQWLQELSEREPVRNVAQRWGDGGVTLVLKPRNAPYPPPQSSGTTSAPKKSSSVNFSARPLKEGEHKDAKMRERADKQWARSKDERGKELLLAMERHMTKDGLYKYDVKREALIDRNLAELQAELGSDSLAMAAQCREHEKLLVAYINARLKPRGLFVSNLHTDIKSSVPLIALVEEMVGTKLMSAVRDPRGRRECIHNGNQLVKLLEKLGVEAHPILIGTDFYEGKISLVYGTLYMLIKRSIELGFPTRKKEYYFDDPPPRRSNAADSDSDSDDKGPRTASGTLVGASSGRFKRPEDVVLASSPSPVTAPRGAAHAAVTPAPTTIDDDEGWEEVAQEDDLAAILSAAPAPAPRPVPRPVLASASEPAPTAKPAPQSSASASMHTQSAAASDDDVLESLLNEMEEVNTLSPRSQVLAALDSPTSPRAAPALAPAPKPKPRLTAAAPSAPPAAPSSASTTVDDIEEFLKQPLPPAPAPRASAVQATLTVPTLLPGAPPSTRALPPDTEGELMQTDAGIVFVPRGMELVMTPQGMMLIPQGQSGNLVQLEDGTLMLQPSLAMDAASTLPSALSTPPYAPWGTLDAALPFGSVPLPFEYAMAASQQPMPRPGYAMTPSVTYATPAGSLYGGGGFGGSNVIFGMDPSLAKLAAQPPGAPNLPLGRTPTSALGHSAVPSSANAAAQYDIDAVLANTRSAIERSRGAQHPATGLGNNPPGSRLPHSNNPPAMM